MYIYIYVICIHIYTYIYTYIYIYTCLLIYYLSAFPVTRKKEKKPLGTRDKKKLEAPRGGKNKKYHRTKIKINAKSVTPVEKKSRDMQSPGQKKNKTHRKTLQCYNYKSSQHEWSQLQRITRESCTGSRLPDDLLR